MNTTPQTVIVKTPIEAYRLAGSMAGKIDGAWSANLDYTYCIVARSTHPDDMCKANRIATIEVAKEEKR